MYSDPSLAANGDEGASLWLSGVGVLKQDAEVIEVMMLECPHRPMYICTHVSTNVYTQVLSLDIAIEKFSIPTPIDFVKVDVEGWCTSACTHTCTHAGMQELTHS